MKTIASLKGPEFLRACNRVRHEVERFMAETDLLKLRQVMPEVPEDATDEEKNALFLAQSKKNISAMLDRLLEEKPEATYRMLCTIVIPDKGEELDGFDLIEAAIELASTPKVISFFTKLARSVEQSTAD